MRILGVTVFIILALVLTCDVMGQNSAPEVQPDKFLISGGRVMGAYPGIKIEKVIEIFGKNNVKMLKKTVAPEGDEYEITEAKIFLLGETNPVFISALSDEGSLNYISIVDSRFHTKEGVSLKSKLAEIKKAYHDLKIEWGEGYVVYSDKAGLSFDLKDPGNEPYENSEITVINLIKKNN